MIAYSDASDLFYVWLKRVLFSTQPWFCFTTDSDGVQEKTDEIIVKRFRAKKTAAQLDHRTRQHYDTCIARAFAEARRVVRSRRSRNHRVRTRRPRGMAPAPRGHH